MARTAFGATLGGSLGNGAFSTSSKGVTPILTAATTADDAAATAAGTLTTDVAAAVAVLVADGASPTQGHVNTLNSAWGLLATAIAAASAATAAAKTAAAPANVVLDVDTAVVTTQNGVRAALREILQAVRGSGLAS